MAVYKRGASWVADITSTKRGEPPFRATATFSTRAEAQEYERTTKARLKEKRQTGFALPDPRITLADALGRFWKEAEAMADADEQSGTQRDGIKLRPTRRFINDNATKVKTWQALPLGQARFADLTATHFSRWKRQIPRFRLTQPALHRRGLSGRM